MEDLTKASHKLAEEIYKQAGAKQQQGQANAQQGPTAENQGPGGETPKKDEDIIDAEYKEEDGDKNSK